MTPRPVAPTHARRPMQTEAADPRWVIVAHPDDELIFAGGAILSHPKASWKVAIATHAESSRRAAESLAAQDALRALGLDVSYLFLGHTDEQWHPTGGIDVQRMQGQLADLGIGGGQRVYTHGAPGEYGHNGHKAVHLATSRALQELAVVSTFSGGAEVLEQVDDPAVLEQKAELFNRAYPSQKGVWTGLAETMRQVMSCESHFALARRAG